MVFKLYIEQCIVCIKMVSRFLEGEFRMLLDAFKEREVTYPSVLAAI